MDVGYGTFSQISPYIVNQCLSEFLTVLLLLLSASYIFNKCKPFRTQPAPYDNWSSYFKFILRKDLLILQTLDTSLAAEFKRINSMNPLLSLVIRIILIFIFFLKWGIFKIYQFLKLRGNGH